VNRAVCVVTIAASLTVGGRMRGRSIGKQLIFSGHEMVGPTLISPNFSDVRGVLLETA
jgi:hypothetical protein